MQIPEDLFPELPEDQRTGGYRRRPSQLTGAPVPASHGIQSEPSDVDEYRGGVTDPRPGSWAGEVYSGEISGHHAGTECERHWKRSSEKSDSLARRRGKDRSPLLGGTIM